MEGLSFRILVDLVFITLLSKDHSFVVQTYFNFEPISLDRFQGVRAKSKRTLEKMLRKKDSVASAEERSYLSHSHKLYYSGRSR